MGWLSRIFEKWTKRPHPAVRDCFAIHRGSYCGETWIMIGESETEYHFINIQNMELRVAPRQAFNAGLNGEIVVYLKPIPHKIFNQLKKYYAEIHQLNY